MLNNKRQLAESPSKQPRQGRVRDENRTRDGDGHQQDRGSSQSYFKKFSPLRLNVPSPNKRMQKQNIEEQQPSLEVINHSSPFANLTNQQSPSQHISVFEPIQSESPQKVLCSPIKQAEKIAQSPARQVITLFDKGNNNTKTSSELKVNILEQENQALKTQIELLRNALMNLCGGASGPLVVPSPDTQPLLTMLLQPMPQPKKVSAPKETLTLPSQSGRTISDDGATFSCIPELPASMVPINAPAKTKKCTESPMKAPMYYQVSPGKGDNSQVNGTITTIEAHQNEGVPLKSHEEHAPMNISPSRSQERNQKSSQSRKEQPTPTSNIKSNSFLQSAGDHNRRRRRSQRKSQLPSTSPHAFVIANFDNYQASPSVRDVVQGSHFHHERRPSTALGYEQESECGQTEFRSKIDEDCVRLVSQYGPSKTQSMVISHVQTPKKAMDSQKAMNEEIVNLKIPSSSCHEPKASQDTKFYEKVIHTLRNELEQFEQEEKKIISLLISSAQPRSTQVQSKSIDHTIPKAITQDFYHELINQAAGQTLKQACHGPSVPQHILTEVQGHPFHSRKSTAYYTKPIHMPLGGSDYGGYDQRSVTELADNDVKVFEEIKMIQEEEEEKVSSSDIVDGTGKASLASKQSSQHEVMLKNLEDVFQFMQSEGQGRSTGKRESRVIRPIKILSPVISSMDGRCEDGEIKTIESSLKKLSPEKTALQSVEKRILAQTQQMMFGISPTSQDEEQTPQCSALNRNFPLQTSPTPDTKDRQPQPLFKMPTGHNLAGLSVKSSSWIAGSQQQQCTGLELGKDAQPRLNKIPSTSLVEEPTPKVIPYDGDFAGDSSAATNQLRMKLSNTLKSKDPQVSCAQPANVIPPFIEDVKEQPQLPPLPPQAHNRTSREDIPSRGPMSKQQLISYLQGSELSSMQNSEKKITRAMDRGESIKRAEEMLSQFIVESQTQKFKRPEFMRNKRGKSQGDALEMIPCAEEIAGIIRNGQVSINQNYKQNVERKQANLQPTDPTPNHHREKISWMQEAINNISFQTHQQDIITPPQALEFSPPPQPQPEPAFLFNQAQKPSMPRISYQEATYFDGDLINLEINPSKNNEAQEVYQPYQVEIKTQDFKFFDYNMKLSPSSQSQQTDQSLENFKVRIFNPDEKHYENQVSFDKITANEVFLQPQIIKHSAYPTPISSHHHESYLNATPNHFESGVTYDRSSPVPSMSGAGSHQKKLTTQHKVKSELSARSEKTAQAQQAAETTMKSKSPQRSQKRHLNPSDVGTSLVSNAIFLAKQLQCLQQPYTEQTRSSSKCSGVSHYASVTKRPKTADHLSKKGVITQRQSILPGGHNLVDYPSRCNAELRHASAYTDKNSSAGCKLKRTSNSGPRSAASLGRKQTAKSQGRNVSNKQGGLNSSRGEIEDQSLHKKIRALRSNHLDMSMASTGSVTMFKRKDYSSNQSQERTRAQKTASQRNLQIVGDHKKFQLLTENLSNPICQEVLLTPTANMAHLPHCLQSSKQQISQSELLPSKQALTNSSSQSKLKKPTGLANQVTSFFNNPSFTDLHTEQSCNERKYMSRISSKNIQLKGGKAGTNQAVAAARPGQQQIKEYYQLKREHERIRKIIQQQSEMMNQSGKVSVGQYGGGRPTNYIIGNHPAFNKKQRVTLKRQGDIDCYDVRETATFDHGLIDSEHHKISSHTTKPCKNCERLKTRGLSTKFCFDHSLDLIQVPDHQKQQQTQSLAKPSINQDLSCNILYIDEEE